MSKVIDKNEYEVFGQQNFVNFRTDVQECLEQMKTTLIRKDVAGDNITTYFKKRMASLEKLVGEIKKAQSFYGDGPFTAFKVELLPEQEIDSNGHPQVLSIHTERGVLKKSGELFTRAA